MMDIVRKILIVLKRCVTCSPLANICLYHTNTKHICYMPCKYAKIVN